MRSEVTEFPLEREYEKPTGVTPRDVARLRDWLQTQPHLPGDHITELDLILAYHCCERSTEVAKQVLDLHFTLKTMFTVIFEERKFDERIKTTLTDYLVTTLDERSPQGYIAFYGRALDLDPKKLVLGDLLRSAFMVLDLSQYAEGSWPGFVMIYDAAGIGLAHLPALDLQLLQQYALFGQEALLLKLKSIHFINTSPIVDKLFMLVKPFLKKEIISMIHFHTAGSRTLDKFYPIDHLPKEAGGKYISSAEYRNKVLNFLENGEEYFMKENKKRVDESKRPGKPKAFSDIFGGVVGSFKKLEID